MIEAATGLRHYMKFLLPVSACAVVYLMGSAQAYPMMSWQEYKSHTYKWPYIYQIDTPGGGSLLYFGAEHLYLPRDPQFSKIEALWNQFHPEIVFNEGNTPDIGQSNKEQAIERYGEVGLVIFLARREAHKVYFQSIDPKFEKEVAALRKKYLAKQLKMFYILRQKSTHDRMSKPESSLETYLDNFIKNDLRALKAHPNSISELESIYAEYFPDRGSYKDAPYSLVDPAPDPTVTETIFNEISRASTEYRDQFMIGQISRFVCQKRVFAVVGATHVVMQEPAIRKLLSEKCS